MKPSRQRSLFRLPLHLFLAACSALLLWAFFYNGARLLLTVPNHFHQVLPKADENP